MAEGAQPSRRLGQAGPLVLDTVVFARGVATPAGVRPSLDRVDLDILPGEIFSIVGRAGSGKTMLLESIVGLQPVSAEQLLVCGTDPRRFPRAVKQRIGVAPRRVAVERKITVHEALRLFAAFYERADPERALDRLGLAAVRHTRVDTLPPPLQQRVSLALALLHDPSVLFADEPTRDLDPEGARTVWDLLRERRDRGRTSVITTNHLDEAARLSDRIAVIDGGRVIAAETPAALMARSRAPERVTFQLLKPAVPVDSLTALDGVVGLQVERSAYVITSSDGVATLRAVLRLLESLGLRPLNLGLHQQTLEDMFFELTAHGARASAADQRDA
ncbi:MAG: ABC transporter ATP-binding protein [Acidobacteria bacterium]|nr:ABC transporter ATP-binding protein [Acidobacteriota bacterium]